MLGNYACFFLSADFFSKLTFIFLVEGGTSHLGLFCLPMYHLQGARHKFTKSQIKFDLRLTLSSLVAILSSAKCLVQSV